jgi:hypothetical protein
MVPPVKEHYGRHKQEVVAMGLKHWWKTGAAPNDYEFGLAHETFQGQPVAYLRSIVQPVRSFAAFCQTIAAEDYRGKRIRFSAALKAKDVTDGWGGLFLRVDGPRLDETLAIDTMEDRPLVGTIDWQQHALVLDVAAAAATIAFGAGLSREGSCWCPSWPLRRSAATCRSLPAPIAHASRRTSTSARPDRPGHQPEQITPTP